MKVSKKFSTILFAGLMTTSAAQAAMITDWSFVNSAGFINWQADGVIASGASNYIDEFDDLQTWYSSLSWGDPVNGSPSSFSVTSPIVGNVTTNGAMAMGTTLVHNNFPVFDNGELLTQATLLNQLSLTPLFPAGPAINAPTIAFNINFFETVNAPGNGVLCPDGNAQGVGQNINGCGDIFAIASPLDLVQQLVIDDYLYTFAIGVMGGSILSDATCGLMGFGSGCYGFVTIENQTNTIQPFFSITAREITDVPAPASFAVFGLGLLLLGRLSRRS